MVNYSKTKVNELKESLIKNGVSVQDLEGLDKKELITLHKETTADSLLDNINLDEDFEENEVNSRNFKGL